MSYCPSSGPFACHAAAIPSRHFGNFFSCALTKVLWLWNTSMRRKSYTSDIATKNTCSSQLCMSRFLTIKCAMKICRWFLFQLSNGSPRVGGSSGLGRPSPGICLDQVAGATSGPSCVEERQSSLLGLELHAWTLGVGCLLDSLSQGRRCLSLQLGRAQCCYVARSWRGPWSRPRCEIARARFDWQANAPSAGRGGHPDDCEWTGRTYRHCRHHLGQPRRQEPDANYCAWHRCRKRLACDLDERNGSLGNPLWINAVRTGFESRCAISEYECRFDHPRSGTNFGGQHQGQRDQQN